MGSCCCQCPCGFLPEQSTWYSMSQLPEGLYKPTTAKRWMEHLKDNVLVSEVSIPGTHDSATYATPCLGLPKVSQCQIMNIKQQLDSGIRFLDIRMRQIDGEIIMCHGIVKLGNFREAVAQIASFLHENPTEFIIITFQNRDSGVNDSGAKILALFSQYRVQYHLSQEIPTVRELRGKVWVCKSYDIDFHLPTFELVGRYGITDSKEIYMQNFYVVDDENPVHLKVSRVLSSVKIEDQKGLCSRLKVNFLSISGPTQCTALFKGPYPYQNALNPEGPNAALYQRLQSEKKVNLGITVMDFPSYQLIMKIILANPSYT